MIHLSRKARLKIAIVTTSIMFLGEIFFGYLTHSIALVADSFHMFSDVMALIIAHRAITLTMSTNYSEQHTFGWQRAETLGALINATFLLALCFTIILSAIQRFLQPEPINNPLLVLIVGGVGLVVNLFTLFLFRDMPLHDHGDHKHETQQSQQQHIQNQIHQKRKHNVGHLNMRGAFLHVLGDALGSVGVIITAIVVKWVPWSTSYYMDPAMSIFIAVITIFTTWPLFKKTSYIVLHVVPSSIPLDVLRKEILKLSHVQDVHEFHVWQLSDVKTIASVHIILKRNDDQTEHSYMKMSNAIKTIFHAHGIHNTTVQFEFSSPSNGGNISIPVQVIQNSSVDSNTPDNQVTVTINSNEEDCLISCKDTQCQIVMCCPTGAMQSLP